MKGLQCIVFYFTFICTVHTYVQYLKVYSKFSLKLHTFSWNSAIYLIFKKIQPSDQPKFSFSGNSAIILFSMNIQPSFCFLWTFSHHSIFYDYLKSLCFLWLFNIILFPAQTDADLFILSQSQIKPFAKVNFKL